MPERRNKMNDEFYNDKVCVVTGAGGTLCSEVAVWLASRGARVALIGRTFDKLNAVAERIKAQNGKCMIKICDVTDEISVKNVAQEISEIWGACSILVNGAGGNNIRAMTTGFTFDKTELLEDRSSDITGFFDIDMDMFKSVLINNTIGTVIPARIFGKQMAQNGGGSIINFASMNTYRPLTRVPAYAMAKAAVSNLTQWLAVYLAPAGIRVNAIAPGFFINERSKQYLGTPDEGLTERGKSVMQHTPMKRFGVPEELIGCFSWLTDDRLSAYVTGITVPVDGGFLSSAGV